MYMERARNDSRDGIGRFIPAFAERPHDFEETFVRIGRIACQEHYGVGRIQVTQWLEECGKQSLIEIRAAFVRHKEAERHELKRLSRRDMTKILSDVYPVRHARYVNPAVARRAAHHLRIVRNGGWIVSPMGDGLWRLGLRVVTAAELLELATKAGFSANLPDGE